MANVRIFKSHMTHFELALTISDHRISTSLKVVLRIFVLALTISDILAFQIFYLQKVGQGH